MSTGTETKRSTGPASAWGAVAEACGPWDPEWRSATASASRPGPVEGWIASQASAEDQSPASNQGWTSDQSGSSDRSRASAGTTGTDAVPADSSTAGRDG